MCLKFKCSSNLKYVFMLSLNSTILLWSIRLGGLMFNTFRSKKRTQLSFENFNFLSKLILNKLHKRLHNGKLIIFMHQQVQSGCSTTIIHYCQEISIFAMSWNFIRSLYVNVNMTKNSYDEIHYMNMVTW